MIAVLGVAKQWTCSYTIHFVFCYPAVAHILIHSESFAFGPNSASKKYRARAGLGLQIEAYLQPLRLLVNAVQAPALFALVAYLTMNLR